MTDGRTEAVVIHVLVSDKGAEVLSEMGDPNDRETRSAWAEQIRDSLRWGSAAAATRLEIRKLTIPVALLDAPEPHTVDTPPTIVELPSELNVVAEKLQRQHAIACSEEARDLIMHALTPGMWEVYEEGHSRGIRLIAPPKTA